MEKKRIIIHFYAIIVCIVAIITFIICLSILVASIMNRSDPLLSGYSKTDLSSFESYKMEVLRSVDKDQAYIPDDEAIKNMYEAAKQEKINKVMHESKTSIVVTSLLILICIILFTTHWFMLKKKDQVEVVPSGG